MADPLISVLLAVYNGTPYVHAALTSVLNQSFHEFELIVVDDASNDDTPALLDQVARSDPRVILITNQENCGLTRSLNRGLQQARGRYIARLDADDLMLPERLEQQFAIMEEQEGLVLLGSEVDYIDHTGTLVPKFDPCPPLSDAAIRWTLLFDNPFYHSSVLFRRTPFGVPVYYDEAFKFGQDRELWARLLQHGQGGNLPTPLTQFRLHDQRLSTQEVRHIRRVQGNTKALERIRLLLPQESCTVDDVIRLKNAWDNTPKPPITVASLAGHRLLARLFRRFASLPIQDRGGLRDVRHTVRMLLLSAALGTSPSVAWQSGLIQELWRLGPWGLLTAVAGKALNKLLKTTEKGSPKGNRA